MIDASKDLGLNQMLDLWVATDLKLQVIVFFRNNPGVIETIQGLAQRLGTSPEELTADIAGHIALGILRERRAGEAVILVYDRSREKEVKAMVEQEIRKRVQGGGA